MNYLLKRFFWSIPTLFAVVIIGFVLLVNTPGDPVNTILHIPADEPFSTNTTLEGQKKEWENKLGLNLPLFYVTIQPSVLPDTFYKITNTREKILIKKLCLQTGQTDQVMNYVSFLRTFKKALIGDQKFIPTNEKDSIQKNIDEITNCYNQIINETNPAQIKILIDSLSVITQIKYMNLTSMVAKVMKNNVHLQTQQSKTIFKPSIQLHKKSRFHQWLFGDGVYSKGIIRGDFGISYTTREPINARIYQSLFWSVLFSGLGIFLAYLISIPIGIRMAIHNNTTGEKIVTVILFALYSIPVFFLATLLQTYLANQQFLHIFEPTGIKPARGFDPEANLFEKIIQTIPYMVLPIICFTYSSIAFLSKLTKTSVSDQLHQPYIITARAKGLPFKKVIYKHAFRNAWVPLVTVFANVFPALVGGSVIIETIFTIPGMGTEMFSAYFTHNIPVIISIFTLTGIFTVVGFFISDVLYVIVDPRIRK